MSFFRVDLYLVAHSFCSSGLVTEASRENWKVEDLIPYVKVRFTFGLFSVPYFSLRSSRSKTLRYGPPSWMSVKSTIKMAASTGKRSILTILRENRGL